MAELPELENALRKAHAAGRADHAKVFADEIRKKRTERPEPEAAPSGVQQFAPSDLKLGDVYTALKSGAAGGEEAAAFGRTVGQRAAKYFTGGEAPAETYGEALGKERAEISRLEKERPGLMTLGQVAGALTPGGAGLVRGGAKLASKIGFGAGVGAGTGAAQGFGAGEGGLENRLERGAIGGAIGGVTGGAISGIVKGIGASGVRPEARIARQEGTKLRAGEARGGIVRYAGQLRSEMPILNELARQSYKGRIEHFGRNTINTVLGRINKSVPDTAKTGNEMVDSMRNAVSDAYDDLLPKLTIKPDAQFQTDLVQAALSLNRIPGKGLSDEVRAVLQTEFIGPMSGKNVVTGDVLKKAQTALRKIEESYHKQTLGTGATSVTAKYARDSINMFRTALNDAASRSHPQYAQMLRELNEVHAHARVIENAAFRGKAGTFSPTDLVNAIKADTRNKALFAAGKRPMQQYAQRAADLLVKPPKGPTWRGRAALGGLGYAGYRYLP